MKHDIDDFRTKYGRKLMGNSRAVMQFVLDRGRASALDMKEHFTEMDSVSLRAGLEVVRRINAVKKVGTLRVGCVEYGIYEPGTPYKAADRSKNIGIFAKIRKYVAMSGPCCVYDIAKAFDIPIEDAKGSCYTMAYNKELIYSGRATHKESGKIVNYYTAELPAEKPEKPVIEEPKPETVATQLKGGGVMIQQGASRKFFLEDKRHVATDTIGRNKYFGHGGGTGTDCSVSWPSR